MPVRLPPSPLFRPRRLETASSLASLASLAALLAALPSPALAQQGGKSVDLHVGLVSPKGDLGDVHDDSGVSLHLGTAYRIFDKVEARLEGTWEHLQGAGKQAYLGADVRGPDAAIYHLIGSVGIEFTNPDNPWEAGAAWGGGMTWYDVEEPEDFETVFIPGDLNRDALTDTAPTANMGVWVGWQATDALLLFYRTQGYLMLGDANNPDDYLGQELTFVTGLGVRVSF